MIVDAGYYNGKEYVEEKTYFFFNDELSEQEKQEILKDEYEREHPEYGSAA